MMLKYIPLLCTAHALLAPSRRPVRPTRLPSSIGDVAPTAGATTSGTKSNTPVKTLEFLYPAAAAATTVAWTACACAALGTHPRLDLPPLHTRLTIAQALVPLPVLWATCQSLASAAGVGWSRLESATYRRLNLGLATASAWLAAAVWFAPSFTGATTVTYAPPLRLAATAAHLATAVIAKCAWAKSSPGVSPVRVLKGVAGSALGLAPPGGTALGDPDASESKVVAPTLLTAAFGAWTLVALAAPFPVATLPLALGRRLSRAAGAHSLLATVAAYCYKDAVERDRDGASTFKTLKKGLVGLGALHLLLLAAKLAFDDWSQYPAAASRLILTALSVATFGLAAGL